MQRTAHGIGFLGWRVIDSRRQLDRDAIRRLSWRLRAGEAAWIAGRMDGAALQSRMLAAFA